MYLYICTFWHSFSCSYQLKIFELQYYPREKKLDPRNTHEKDFGSTKQPEKNHFEPTKYPRKRNLDAWIQTRNKFGPTKYSQEEISNPRNRQEKKFCTQEIPHRHYGTMALDPRQPCWHATHWILHNCQNLIQFAFSKKKLVPFIYRLLFTNPLVILYRIQLNCQK